MFDQDYEQPKKDKLPTIKQYEKSLSKKSKAFEQSFEVEVVWLPGSFPNVTLQTHAFRIILNDSHSLYKSVVDYFSDFDKPDPLPGFRVKINDRTTLSFTLTQRPNDDGNWKRIGEYGFRFVSS